MTNPLYTAEAHVTGGRMHGHGRSADGELEVDLRVPRELGGEGGGTNPEELFAVGFAACFEGALADELVLLLLPQPAATNASVATAPIGRRRRTVPPAARVEMVDRSM